MRNSAQNVETTRIQSSLGVLIVVSHPNGVRVGQTFSQNIGQGTVEWHAQCVDWYGQGIPSITSRVPQNGGYNSLDDLEQALIREATVQMKTDYWSDR